MILSAQLFNGGLAVNSTCRDCGLVMNVTAADQRVHPTCTLKPTELEELSGQWIDAILREDADEAALITKRIDHLEQVIDLPGAAVQYASWGWPVFPLGRQSKAPAISKAKGGKGYKDATSDAERLKRWWDRHPDHNIGLATGQMFDVVDVDTKDKDGNPSPQGVLSFLEMLDTKRLPQCYGIAMTASGGMHLYVKPTGKGNYAGIRPGVDYRGKGGYVVAPPSTLGATWRGYHWLFPPSPELKEHNASEF